MVEDDRGSAGGNPDGRGAAGRLSAGAAEIEGKIKSVDPATPLHHARERHAAHDPVGAVVDDHRLLQPGAEIRASFEEKDGQKIVMKLESAR